MRSFFSIILVSLGLVPVSALAEGQIQNTKHNLSVTGPGPVKAATEKEICIFCHAPHNASPKTPLWNRGLGPATYRIYESPTAQLRPEQPNGSSRLCLSCHDGTIALGNVLSRATPISFSGGKTTLSPGDAGFIGTDLSDDHPISFHFTSSLAAADTQLKDPSALTGAVHLDKSGFLQCTSCHDPHSERYKFLVADTAYSALCITCHRRDGWEQSSHHLSAATWNNAGPNPWSHTPYTTVSGNACENCHRPHSAPGHEYLLNFAAEEDNCYVCHNGNVAVKNVQSDFNKFYHHPVERTAGIHKPNENTQAAARHIECLDCHNPHATSSGSASAPSVSGPLADVSGENSSGSPIERSSYEYEVCFKCHADNADLAVPFPRRVIVQANTRLEFSPSNPSYHPVERAGVNTDVPSLIQPLTTASIIYCTDCHSSDTSQRLGGSGANGPHGSVYRFLLVRNYSVEDRTAESSGAYALCYRCHSRSNILADVSFKEHKKHIVNIRTPCSICHDPHGISLTQGTNLNNSHLINFDRDIVLPSRSTGRLAFEDLGSRSGRCYLTCHNKDHAPKEYP